jgi:hypothetical protein
VDYFAELRAEAAELPAEFRNPRIESEDLTRYRDSVAAARSGAARSEANQAPKEGGSREVEMRSALPVDASGAPVT